MSVESLSKVETPHAYDVMLPAEHVNFKPQIPDNNRSRNAEVHSNTLVFGRQGKSRIFARTKGWLPYGISRQFNKHKTSWEWNPNDEDTEILNAMSSDEVIIRLSRLVINLENSPQPLPDEVKSGIKAVTSHVERMHNFMHKLTAST